MVKAFQRKLPSVLAIYQPTKNRIRVEHYNSTLTLQHIIFYLSIVGGFKNFISHHIGFSSSATTSISQSVNILST